MEITIKKRAAENLDYEYDHFSSLPDGLLHYILSFLETKDVVLTGILSRRWRDLSSSVPNLHVHSPLNGDEDDFVRFVDLALLLNSAPKIWKFHLWFRYREYYVSHVDSWIDFAMRKGVKELDLGFPYNLGSFGNDSYKLPSRVLNCESLISLRLRNCRLEASNFVNLPKLTALSLVFEALGDGMVEELLKGCPMLEDLVIKASSYNSFPPIKICSSSSSWLQLKRLAIVGVDNPRVDIEAPNLQILKISTGRFGEYFFEDMPFLREAELSFSYIPERTKG